MLFTSKFVAAPEWRAWLAAHRLDSLDALYAVETGTPITNTRTTQVRRVEVDGKTIFIKKYWITKPSQVVSGATRGMVLGKSKVRREYENLARLRSAGLNAPAPVAYGEQRTGGCLVRSCLVSEGIPDARGLHVLIRDGLREVGALANYVGRLHDRQFFHCDLFWRNILVSGNSLDHFYLIDAHKGGHRRGNRAQDLATLDAAAPAFFRRTERLRFFLRYVNHTQLTAADKRLIRQVLRLAEPLRAKQIQRARKGK